MGVKLESRKAFVWSIRTPEEYIYHPVEMGE